MKFFPITFSEDALSCLLDVFTQSADTIACYPDAAEYAGTSGVFSVPEDGEWRRFADRLMRAESPAERAR